MAKNLLFMPHPLECAICLASVAAPRDQKRCARDVSADNISDGKPRLGVQYGKSPGNERVAGCICVLTHACLSSQSLCNLLYRSGQQDRDGARASTAALDRGAEGLRWSFTASRLWVSPCRSSCLHVIFLVHFKAP